MAAQDCDPPVVDTEETNTGAVAATEQTAPWPVCIHPRPRPLGPRRLDWALGKLRERAKVLLAERPDLQPRGWLSLVLWADFEKKNYCHCMVHSNDWHFLITPLTWNRLPVVIYGPPERRHLHDMPDGGYSDK